MSISSFLEKIIVKKPLTESERFSIVKFKRADPCVEKYLYDHLQNLIITIEGNKQVNILKLMKKGALEGFCWQTTEAAILLFEDDDYIVRGRLKFSENNFYWHSFICLKVSGKDYVFDPCLEIVCPKDLYMQTFEVGVYATVTAKEIRDYLLPQLDCETSTKEIKIRNQDNADILMTMCGNDMDYQFELEKGKIKKLSVCLYRNTL